MSSMKIKDILKLGGEKLSKEVMSSKVMIATGDVKMADLANKLWDLIVHTDYLRPAVHGVLVKKYTHKEASEIYDVKESYLRNLVGLEGARLQDDLGLDIYPFLVGEEEMPTKASIDALVTIVEGLSTASTWLTEDLFDKLMFSKMRSQRSVRTNTLSDNEFISTVQQLDFLSKPKMESKLDEVGETTLGYLVYLLRTDDKYLTEEDKTRKEIIKEVWWL